MAQLLRRESPLDKRPVRDGEAEMGERRSGVTRRLGPRFLQLFDVFTGLMTAPVLAIRTDCTSEHSKKLKPKQNSTQPWSEGLLFRPIYAGRRLRTKGGDGQTNARLHHGPVCRRASQGVTRQLV